MPTARRAAAAVLGLALAAGCAGNDPGPAGPALEEIPVPAAPGSGEANLFAAGDGDVYLSWIEAPPGRAPALRFAKLGPGGWSSPRTVAEDPEMFVNWADFPSLVELADGSLVAHWLSRSGPGPYAYDVRITRSRDGGETWSPHVSPHRDGTRTEHGFVSLVPLPEGGVAAVWLDGRNFAAATPPHLPPGPEMTLRAAILGPDGDPGPEELLDPRVCDCCQTGAALTPEGLVVVYRDRSAEEIRDVARVRREGDGWGEPALVAADGWRIPGCPVNGPAIDARGSDVAVAWFTLRDGQAGVWVAFSTDAGETFTAPRPVDDGRPLGRVDAAWASDRTVLVSWLESVGDVAELRLRPMGPEGTAGPSVTLASTGAERASGFPRIVVSGDRVIVAWRDTLADPPRLRTAALAAPL